MTQRKPEKNIMISTMKVSFLNVLF